MEKRERDELLERYFRGETTVSEEQFLRWECDEEEPALGALFAGMEALAEERFPRRAATLFVRARLPLRLFAFAALLAVGIVVAARLHYRPYCYIDGVAVCDADRAMETTLYLERFDCFGRTVDLFDPLMND